MSSLNLKHIEFDYRFPKRFRDERQYEVDFVHNSRKKSDRKILFLLDHVPTEDLRKGRLLSGATGDLFYSVLGAARDKLNAPDPASLDWMVANFNCFKTYGKPDEFRQEAEQHFYERACKIICQYKPDTVVLFGDRLLDFFTPDRVRWSKHAYHHFLGTTMNCSVESGKKSHEFTVVPNLSFTGFCGGMKHNLVNTGNLLGYFTRNTVTGLEGEMRYSIPYAPKYKAVYVDTIKAFDKMLKDIEKAEYVSIDTETESLNKKVNRIQTAQFCCDPKRAYVVPIYHKDTPFSGKDIQYISKKLKDFFEFKNKNKLHIYTNAKFDLNVMKANFGIRYYFNDVWDIQAGEFGYDENMKILQSFIFGKGGYYGLGNLAMQYGCGAFLDNEFGKEQRHTIKDANLDKPLIRYCCLDVVVPLLIYYEQVKRAKDNNYKHYEKLVGNQISDQIHSFSTMESTGAYCDVSYLFKLKHPDSVINQMVEEKEKEIFDSDAVRKVNKILTKDEHIPTTGMFGSVDVRRFDLSKSEHKQILFFDVLKLKPLNTSKKLRPNGEPEGKIDKDFQDKYKDNPVVASYTTWQKACKLRNAFVNSLIKLWGQSDDFQHDQRIRPNYSYTKVVTGRTSASDPY